MRVKPAKPGLIVRDPRTMRAIPDEGLNVPNTTYWVRRIKAGDVVSLEPAKEDSEVDESATTAGTPAPEVTAPVEPTPPKPAKKTKGRRE